MLKRVIIDRSDAGSCCLSGALTVPNHAVAPCRRARTPVVLSAAPRCPSQGRDDAEVSINSEGSARHCFVDKPEDFVIGHVLSGLRHALCPPVVGLPSTVLTVVGLPSTVLTVVGLPSTVLTLKIRIRLKILHPFSGSLQ